MMTIVTPPRNNKDSSQRGLRRFARRTSTTKNSCVGFVSIVGTIGLLVVLWTANLVFFTGETYYAFHETPTTRQLQLLLNHGVTTLENGGDGRRRQSSSEEQQVRHFLRPRFSFPIGNISNTLLEEDERYHDDSDDDHIRLCQPSHIHLSPATNVNSITKSNKENPQTVHATMTVSFTLPDLPQCSTTSVTPKIYYGRIGDEDDDGKGKEFVTTPQESFQFRYSNYLRSFRSRWIHHAVLQNLKGGSEPYWYQIRVTENDDTEETTTLGNNSTIYNFTTPPLPSEPVRIALIADWGGSQEALRTMRSMMSRTKSRTNIHGDSSNRMTDPFLSNSPPPFLSLVVVAGDISYANSHLPSWEQWLQDMEPLYSSTPLLVAAGNHEIECNRDNFHIFQAYESYFRVPNRIAAAHLEPIPRQLQDCTHPAQFNTTYWYGNSFYAYRHGGLQIIVLNSYTDTTKGSVQYEWLKHELETNIDRSVTPWLLVVFHCPFHTTFRGHNDESNPKLMMQDIEPLFVQHQVNLVLAGHNHAYVRSYPMVGDKTQQHGPIYLTIGTGGDSHSLGPLRPISSDPWVAHRDNTEYGFGELVVVNATYAYFERILNNGAQANPAAKDAVWVRNIAMAIE